MYILDTQQRKMRPLPLFWSLCVRQTNSYLWQKLLMTNYSIQEVTDAAVFLANTYSSFLSSA